MGESNLKKIKKTAEACFKIDKMLFQFCLQPTLPRTFLTA